MAFTDSHPTGHEGARPSPQLLGLPILCPPSTPGTCGQSTRGHRWDSLSSKSLHSAVLSHPPPPLRPCSAARLPRPACTGVPPGPESPVIQEAAGARPWPHSSRSLQPWCAGVPCLPARLSAAGGVRVSVSGGDNEQKPWYERTLGLIGTGCSINPACAVEVDVIRNSGGKERKREGGGREK